MGYKHPEDPSTKAHREQEILSQIPPSCPACGCCSEDLCKVGRETNKKCAEVTGEALAVLVQECPCTR